MMEPLVPSIPVNMEFKGKYNVLGIIGSGTYADVLKCCNKETRGMYACKQLKDRYENWTDVNNLPEIKLLKDISKHPNILHMVSLHYNQNSHKVSIVFEMMDSDLNYFIKQQLRQFTEPHAKNIIVQIIRGLNHLHKFGIFHRDVKPENILVRKTGDGELIVLGDFGSVRQIQSTPPFEEYIATRWYRSPECILTNGYYGVKMDIWGAGCIFYEILTLSPLFPGENEMDQIKKIHDVFIEPPMAVIKRFYEFYTEEEKISTNLYIRVKIKFLEKILNGKSNNSISKRWPGGILIFLPGVSSIAKELLKTMIEYDEHDRPTAEALLNHEYFKNLKNENTIAKIVNENVGNVPSKVIEVLKEETNVSRHDLSSGINCASNFPGISQNLITKIKRKCTPGVKVTTKRTKPIAYNNTGDSHLVPNTSNVCIQYQVHGSTPIKILGESYDLKKPYIKKLEAVDTSLKENDYSSGYKNLPV